MQPKRFLATIVLCIAILLIGGATRAVSADWAMTSDGPTRHNIGKFVEENCRISRMA